jgi:arsenite methyltransferase
MTDYLQHRNDYNDPRLASVFDELSFWSARFGQLLFKHIEIRTGLNILDLGCGTGFPTFELAHVFGRSCHVTGIDIWKPALQRAASKLDFYRTPNALIVEADGAAQPFVGAEFDLIVSNLGLNNFAEPGRAINECFRVARAGAKIVLTTNLKGHYREFYKIFRETLIDVGKTSHLERLDANEDHRGTRDSVCGLLEGGGFQILKVVEDGFQMRFADGSSLLNHSLTRLGFMDGWRSVIDPDEEREVFAKVEEKLNEEAARKGELVMSVPMLYVEGVKSLPGNRAESLLSGSGLPD